MKIILLLFLNLGFQLNLIPGQDLETGKLDSLVKTAIALSEEALYDARFAEAVEMVNLSYFGNFNGLKDKHVVMLIIQGQRIEGFMNRLYQIKSRSYESFIQLDSLFPCIGEIKEKEIQARFYLTFSRAHRSLNNVDSALVYETKAVNLFNEIKAFDKVAEIQAGQISRLHLQYLNEGKIKEVLELIPKYEQEIEFSSNSSKYVLAYNTRHLAQIHLNQTLDYVEALRLFEISLQLREEIGFKPFIPASYSSLGDVYTKMTEYKSAIEMYLKAIELADKIGFVRYQSYPYLGIGDIYTLQGNEEKATENYIKALKVASMNNYETDIDSAIERIDRTKK